MASWQETYEQLKKKKKQIDNAKSTSEIKNINTSYNNNKGKVSLPSYTNNNQLPSLPSLPTLKTTVPMPTAKKEEKKWWQDIFDGGALSDGYDFGDVTKTILGTTADVGIGIVKGVSDIGLGGAKLIAGGTAQVADWVGQDEWADKVRNRIAGKDKETNERLKKYTPSGLLGTADEKLDSTSVLGETGDEITQGVGYYAGMLALQSVGVPWQATAGVTAGGNELSNAYANGATDGEAWLSAGISAGVEIGTEYLTGGVKLPGTGKVADEAVGKVTEKISKKGLKYLLEAGYKIGGEGVEEVLAGFGSAIGQKLTYMDEKELNELYSSEDALKDFVIGMAVSGITNGATPSTYQNINAGRSLITERTPQEAQVIETETQKRIKAQEDKGITLITKEKNQIEEQVTNEVLSTQNTEATQEIAPTNNTIQNEQPVNTQETVQDIDSQIAVLEEQLMATENEAEYERLSTQIKELENRADQLENGAVQQEIAPVQTASVEQTQQPTTQEVESNLATDVESNTQKTPITESIDELKAQLENAKGFFEKGAINEKIRALENGYTSVEDYRVAEEKRKEELSKQRQLEKEQKQKEREIQIASQQEALEKDIQEATPLKRRQYEIVQEANPMLDDYHTGIRSPKDIKSFDETINDEDSFVWGDFSKEDAEKALKKGEVTVYSSYPIEQGVFVSTSKQMATEYAGGDSSKVYSKTIPLNEVAWINGDEGQYAKVEETLQNSTDKTKGIYTEEQIVQKMKKLQESSKKNATENHPPLTDEFIEELTQQSIKWAKESGQLKEVQDIAPIRQELAETTKELVKTIKDTTKEVTKLKKELNEVKESVSEIVEEGKALTEADLPYLEQLSKEALNQEVAPIRNNLTEEESRELDIYETLPFDLSHEEQARMRELQAEEQNTPEEDATTEAVDPFKDRDYENIRKVKAYQYEHPEVRPFFQAEAKVMLGDLNNSQKGERYVIGDISQTGNGDYRFAGQKRHTTEDIAYLLDSQYGYTYADIRKGLNAIIEDHGAENIAVAKRIEFALNDRLLYGYTDLYGEKMPPNQEYIDLLKTNQWNDYFDSYEKNDIAPYETTSEEVSNVEVAPIEKKPTIAEKNQAKLDTLNEEFEPSYEPVIEYLDNLEKRRQEKRNKKATQVELEDTTPMKEATKWQQAKTTLKTLFTNNKAVYDEIAKETGNKEIRYKADRLNTVSGETADITTAQLDNDFNPVGKSLNAIFENAESKGLGEASQDFLYHLSNMNRHKRDKGSAKYTAVDSQIFVEEFKKKYPKLSSQLLKDIHTWNKNRRNNLVDAGIISDKTAQLFEELDAEYVPFFEDRGYNPTYQSVGEIKTKNVVKYAKGGSKNVLPIKEAMISQNMAERKAIAQNDLYREVMKSYGKKAELGADVRLKAIDFSDSLYADSNGDKYLTAYVDGERKSIKISDFMYNNIQQAENAEKLIRNVEEQLSFISKPLQAFSSYVRNIHTTWSPSFIITNPLKDIQDAPFNSKDAVKFAKNYKSSYTDVNYAKNLNKIAENFKKVTGQDITSIQDESRLKGKAKDLYNNYESGMLWNKFVAGYGSVKLYGDTYSNMDQVVSKQTQKVSKDSKLKKMASVVPNVNEFMELATRYAEFKSSIENGASISEAFYNAKDITTNFGRGGVITKALNRNGATFLNASVQGFSKFVRNFSGENGAKGVVGSIAKAVTLGVLPAIFNHLAFGGDDEDEDYKALPDYIKDNYYLIKTDDGEFIRIPKGRALSVFGSAARRTLEFAEGEKDAFEGYFKNAVSQSGPSNFLESNAFAPLIQASNNETWYGGDLIPTRLQDKPVNEQYDESTDAFSKWLGQTWLAQKLNVSPYQINYVLDQYTGGIGDFILPYMTEEANSDGTFLAPLKDKFTANSTMDNKYAGEFYDKMDELEVIANGENATEEDQLRSQYMSAVSWEMSALYKEKREIQNDSSLTKAEKYEKVKAVQKEINAIAENALNTYDTGTFGEYYSSIGDYQFNKYTDRNGEEAWGTLYEDEAEELKELGLTDEEYNTYFAMKQEFTELNNDYYEQKDELEEKYGKDSDEYDVASDELYWEKKNTIIDKIINSGLSSEEKAYVYNKYYSSDKIDVVTTAGIDIDYLLDYDKNDFVADYNNKGKAISNSRKNKVIEYVNEYDLSIAEKAILIKSKNTFKFDDYNYEIVDYVDNLDIPYEEKVYILKSLDMEVEDDGTINW